MSDRILLGIDSGSVSVSVALLGPDGEILRTAYAFHLGKILQTVDDMIRRIDAPPAAAVARTASTPPLGRGERVFDSSVAMIAACLKFFPDARSLLYIGGEKFGLVCFDGRGGYRSMRSNSSCAAGTGSFLDQQARRLGFPGPEALAAEALRSAGEPPRISSRCAVFARTDLIHAQQSGRPQAEICDGLCRGLAQNVADCLTGGEKPEAPLIFAGGVSLNAAVRRHLELLLGVEARTHEHSHLFSAIGACLCMKDGKGEKTAARGADLGPGNAAGDAGSASEYLFPPLTLRLSRYPDFNAHARRVFTSRRLAGAPEVEMDLYMPLAGGSRQMVFLGIDIGSTSTKAVLLSADSAAGTGMETPVVMGLYTRTAGAPLAAVQAILEAVADECSARGALMEVAGAATTGSGRKYLGAILGADLILDEISAHARAAVALEPLTDTIIEIGGQDAKFTTLRGGNVSFSRMNTVCAAGTGAFLEEQAARLSCPLAEYSGRVEGLRAPLVSDRCAVFMERDINRLLAQGRTAGEILAAALFCVRENYLLKVAREASIGEAVCFQGATAKNKALVAAFEQKLDRPVFVSRYCHLTGALGAALSLAARPPDSTSFRGLDLWETDIPVRGETCLLCANHCKLRIARVAGEDVAYGLLCGRDYREGARRGPRPGTAAQGYSLLREHDRAWAAVLPDGLPDPAEGLLVGLPFAMNLCEDLPLWRHFFRRLGVRTVASRSLRDAVTGGKRVEGAEFCAPVAALHGHAFHLMERADRVFLPVYMEGEPDGGRRRSYCYYTQFSSAAVFTSMDEERRGRILAPMIDFRRVKETVEGLLAAVRTVKPGATREAVDEAFRETLALRARARAALAEAYRRETRDMREPFVVLAGRPYAVLSEDLGKGIPALFASLGLKAFSQDMLPQPAQTGGAREVDALLGMFHWQHAVGILQAARVAVETPLLYPVLVTFFKCSPDSFAIEYFQRILDGAGKPYLILQLDDHDSNVGYETRIEAAVASFRNHARAGNAGRPSRHPLPVVPRIETRPGLGERLKGGLRAQMAGRTVYMPEWDPYGCLLFAAHLRRYGIDARTMPEDALTIRRSMRSNSGQCIPLSIIAEDFQRDVRRDGLDPARAVLWVPRSGYSCNIPMFPFLLKSLLEAQGGGFERASVYLGDISNMDVSPRAMPGTYLAFLAGGLLRRAVCRIRPYETERGAADVAAARALAELGEAFERGRGSEAAMRRAAARFAAVPRRSGTRPKVAIFGDLYSRDNDVLNQDLLRAIEEAGGEAVVTPYIDFLQIVAQAYFRTWMERGEILPVVQLKPLMSAMDVLNRRWRVLFDGILGPEVPVGTGDAEEVLGRFGVRASHEGESFENLLKIAHLLRVHPDIRLFVQANPAFCCPSLVTEAMARRIREFTGVPVVSLTYDGTGAYRNDAIVPYLAFSRGGP